MEETLSMRKPEAIAVTVLVQDMDRAVQFYSRVLGLSLHTEGEEWALFSEGVLLQLNPEPSADVRYEANAVLLTLVVANVEEAFRELTALGAAFYLPPTQNGPFCSAALRDTENNLVQILSFSEAV